MGSPTLDKRGSTETHGDSAQEGPRQVYLDVVTTHFLLWKSGDKVEWCGPGLGRGKIRSLSEHRKNHLTQNSGDITESGPTPPVSTGGPRTVPVVCIPSVPLGTGR